MPSRAEEMLGCALTFRDAPPRDAPLATTFEDEGQAVAEWMRVLLHEAREAMQEPLEGVPDVPFLSPVDLDTAEPGIVDSKEEVRVLRLQPPLPRATYRARPSRGAARANNDEPPPSVATVDADAAAKAVAKALKQAESRAAAGERRAARAAEAKRERAAETAEEREARLAEARRKRAEAKRAKEERAQAQGGDEPIKKKRAAPPPPLSEEALTCPDAALHYQAPPPPKKRARGDKAKFFAHPLPHHRHLQALQQSAPHAALLPALLRGEACDALEVIQGPPGTGKTRALVERVRDEGKRVLLCAPTNVGAAALYRRCVDAGLGDETALAMAPERVPPGTAVLSNDFAGRRLVCATVSARAGAMLDGQRFQVVALDEAAQCAEALVWGLLRPEVELLVLAGDVHQLPAQVSETGKALKHERSLMERLASLNYDNTVTLTVQNRMAPQLLAYPNRAFYADALTTGPHAPAQGRVEWVEVEGGEEEESGTSWCNRAEARAAAEHATQEGEESVVLIAPYAAQCRLLLAQKTGREVHTVDSFQGREADVVVLSLVRDGTRGSVGFWQDARRLTVALTRARKRLVIVASSRAWPTDSPLHALRSALLA